MALQQPLNLLNSDHAITLLFPTLECTSLSTFQGELKGHKDVNIFDFDGSKPGPNFDATVERGC